MKEKSPASLLSTPHARAPVIVEPERDMPGKVPKPCIKPIIIDCFTEIPFDFPLISEEILPLIILEKISRAPVTINPAQTYFALKSGINLLVKMPITPVINVATITAIIVIWLNFCVPQSPSSGFSAILDVLRVITQKKTQISLYSFFL